MSPWVVGFCSAYGATFFYGALTGLISISWLPGVLGRGFHLLNAFVVLGLCLAVVGLQKRQAAGE